ncbi:MAG: glycosyltransferase family 2 protein [Bacteroidetes bacterium]|jgi:glycosyltransferase involved in cell wall biosynthesis|nr:glycosyltransferase family 2 protein [Bacteroidota bacterium]
MSSPLVSIIIPAYNSAKYLAATIQSALDQTWANKEIIIVDDGSKDNTLAIAKGFESETVKVLSQENKGASAARNKGLSIAKGEYIQFLDADDLLSPNKIAAQLKKLNGSHDLVGICDTVYFPDGSNPDDFNKTTVWYSNDFDDPVDFLIKLYGGRYVGPEYGGMIQPNAWLTPRSVIDKSGLWNEMRNPDDDGEFFCRVLLASSGIRYSGEAVNYYRKFDSSGSSLSNRKDYESLSNILKSTDSKAENVLKRKDTPLVRMIFSRHYYENAFVFFPMYPDLVHEAEKKARKLAPHFGYNPFEDRGGSVYILSKLIGWKATKYLLYRKQLIVRSFK